GIANPSAPVGAGDKFSRYTVLRQARHMQPEGELDDIGYAVGGHALAALILEGISVAARCQKKRFQMLDANDAKMLGRDRLAVLAHRRQQLGNARAVDVIDTE